MSCPDAYMGRQGAANHIVDITKRYSRADNPFFTVEAADGEMGAAHAFYAIGGQRAIGYSGMGNDGLLDWFTKTGINLPAWHTPAGMDSPTRLFGFGGPGSTKALPPVPAEYEAKALSQAFLTLSQIAPQILEHQSKGTIAGVVVDKEKPDEKVKLGNYILNVGLPRGRGTPNVVPDAMGYGVFMAAGRTSTWWRAIICTSRSRRRRRGRRLRGWPSRKRAGSTRAASGWRRICSGATIPPTAWYGFRGANAPFSA